MTAAAIPAAATHLPDPIDFTEIDDLLRRNKKVQAVRRFRRLDRAAGLKEAVDAVEARGKTL